MATTAPPRLNGVLETALYVDDKPGAVAFYRDVMGLPVLRDEERITGLDAGGSSVLLIFGKGMSIDGEDTPGGHIPGHDGAGNLHMCFKIAETDYEPWRTHLRGAGVKELSEVVWERGGRSYYFADPEGHVIEVATPGLWANYEA